MTSQKLFNRVAIGDIAKTASGGTPKSGEPEYYLHGTIPWIRSGEVRAGRIFNAESYITEIALKESSAKQLPPKTVLIAMYGATAGQVGILEFPCAINQAICAIPPTDSINSKFLYWLLKTRTKHLLSLGTGAAQPNISQEIIRDYLIPLPTPEEQERIVAVLEVWAEYLEKLEKRINLFEENQHWLIRDLICKTSLHSNSKGSGEVRSLGSALAKTVGGGTPSRDNPKYWNGDIPWATVKDFTNFNHAATSEYISAEGLKNSATNLIPSRTVIIPTRMALGKVGLFSVNVSINQDLKALFPKDELESEFLYFFLKRNARVIESLGTGSTVKGITLPVLHKLSIKIPTLDEQKRIVKNLSDMDTAIKLLKYKQRLVTTQRKFLLNKLVTGEIRTPEDLTLHKKEDSHG